MTSQLLILSDRQHDIDFWKQIAEKQNLAVQVSIQKDEIAKLIQAQPNPLILWDGECEKLNGVDELFLNLNVSHRVFVVTDGPVRAFPHSFTPPAFAHQLYRRYDKYAEFLCSHLLSRLRGEVPLGFENCFFNEIIATKKIVLSNTTQKSSIVEEFRKLMVANGIPDRVSDVGADAADELLMNAIFSAPKDANGVHYRRTVNRASEIELTGKELVEAELVICKDLIGIRITDYFGSLNTKKTLSCLGKGFVIQDYQPPEDNTGAGLGILKMMKSSTSLAFFVVPGERTESIALIGNTRNFKELRNSFCFFSIQSASDH